MRELDRGWVDGMGWEGDLIMVVLVSTLRQGSGAAGFWPLLPKIGARCGGHFMG